MLFLTAYNTAFKELGKLCERSIHHHISKSGRHHAVTEIIPDNYDRKPSWYKVQAILKHLPDHDYVFWIDADALMIGDFELRSWLGPTPLNISYDENGPNNGVAAWKNCPQSFTALSLMDKMYPIHKDGKWFEQHCLHDFIGILEHTVQPKEIFNAYPSDRTKDSQILHLPGMRNDDRLPIMRRVAEELQIP
jgi:hypothetical protein